MPSQIVTVKMLGLTSRARLQHVLEKRIATGGLILDVGCGGGELMASLKMEGVNVIGLDSDLQQLENAKTVLKQARERCDLVAATATNMPFRDGSFRTAYCMEVINMMQNDECTLKELARILEHGGTCTISVPYKNYPMIYDPLNRLLERIGIRHRQIGIWSPGLKQLYDPSDLMPRLKRLGLAPIELFFIGRWLVPALENYLALSLYYEVLTRKSLTSMKEITHTNLFKALTRILDMIISFDGLPNIRGTHFIIKTKKVVP